MYRPNRSFGVDRCAAVFRLNNQKRYCRMGRSDCATSAEKTGQPRRRTCADHVLERTPAKSFAEEMKEMNWNRRLVWRQIAGLGLAMASRPGWCRRWEISER